jgi:hypothetical protein
MAFSGCAGVPVEIPHDGVRSKTLHYPRFSKYLEERAHAPVYQIRFQRDSTGSKLFVSFYFPKGDEPCYRTLIFGESEVKEISGYPRVWYDDQAVPVFRLEGVKEWYEGRGQARRFFSKYENAKYVFKNGPTVPFREISDLDGVLGSDLVIVRFGSNSKWVISKADTPRVPQIELPRDLDHPQSAFAVTNALIVFGTFKPSKNERTVKCLVYRAASVGYQLAEQIPMSWAGTIFDLYPKSGDTLASGTATKFAGYFRFNIQTKDRTRLPGAADDSLFLRDGLASALDTLLGR